ncbi:hypothetical protein F4823DRAFT_628426 [Ustulina deusta]|nr:hypothetical protein F4823DRAFT_628426 [Ustulina deusta]
MSSVNRSSDRPELFEPTPIGPAMSHDIPQSSNTTKLFSPPSHRRSSLQRAATVVRKLVIGRTPAEKAAKMRKDMAKKRAAEERAALDARRRKSLRAEILRTGSVGWDSLHELAASEGVYLTPRAHRNDRFFGDDYSLASGIVARVSGRIDGEYIFLARDKSLYIGRHDLGRDAREIPKADEWIYRDYREIARAYYQLCE